MSVAENGIFISSLDNLKNKKDENYLYKLKSLVDNCEFCKPPFSLVINDNGYISIYGSGFYDSTSKELKNFIENEILYMKNLGNPSIDDLSSLENLVKKKTYNDLIYCSPETKNKGLCKQ